MECEILDSRRKFSFFTVYFHMCSFSVDTDEIGKISKNDNIKPSTPAGVGR